MNSIYSSNLYLLALQGEHSEEQLMSNVHGKSLRPTLCTYSNGQKRNLCDVLENRQGKLKKSIIIIILILTTVFIEK